MKSIGRFSCVGYNLEELSCHPPNMDYTRQIAGVAMLKLTDIFGSPSRSQIRPGMAYFVGTGPKGLTCGSCNHHSEQSEGQGHCGMYRKMTGRVGAKIQAGYRACKYYETRRRTDDNEA